MDNIKGILKLDKAKISNPLTIIGVFASIAEVSMVGALPLMSENLHSIFIWFIMLFPVLIVSVFFLTLNKNPRVLYAPSDFKDENIYLENMKLGMKVGPESSDINSKDKVPLKEIKNKTFRNQDIHLDNHNFISCVFTNCKIIYSAEGPIGLWDCQFDGVQWELEGPASSTLGFLTLMYTQFGEGGKSLVEGTIENIKNEVYK